MKKIFTLIFALIFSGAVFAQRNIDWQVSEIISPANMQSSTQGTPFNIKFVVKNNGTDAVQANDTLVWFAVLIDIEQQNIIVQAPAQAVNGNRYAQLIGKTLNSGDTMHISRNLNINAFLNFSRDVRVGLNSELVNRANGGITDSDAENNNLYNDIIWFNIDQNGVGIDAVKYNNNIAVYPNPANNELNVKLLMTKFSDAVVELYDIQGQLVKSSVVNSSVINKSFSMDVADLPHGIYTVRVTNGDEVSTSKVSISH